MPNKGNNLITGVEGFVGTHLAQYLLSIKENVVGTYLHPLKRSFSNESKITELYKLDLLDKTSIINVLKKVKPVRIFNLAGKSSNLESMIKPEITLQVNLEGTVNLLESVRSTLDNSTAVVLVGSSEEYGVVKKDDLPINEDLALRPQNPYALSKVLMEEIADYYVNKFNINIIKVRSFTLEGPGKKDKYAISSFAKQIAIIEKGKMEPQINVGDLSPFRDLTDVRDAVKAYFQIARKGRKREVYNLCSGKTYKIEDLLKMLISLSKMKDKIKINIDKSLLRPNQNPVIIGNNSKLSNLTGWKPQTEINQTLKDVLEFWRNSI